jgi:hypothetical protein
MVERAAADQQARAEFFFDDPVIIFGPPSLHVWVRLRESDGSQRAVSKSGAFGPACAMNQPDHPDYRLVA